MKQSAWYCMAVSVIISFLLLTFVKMSPIENSVDDSPVDGSMSDCRFELEVYFSSETHDSESQLLLDGREVTRKESCQISFGKNLMDANDAVNEGMINYGIAAALISQGYVRKHLETQKSSIAAIKKLYQGASMTCGNVVSCVAVLDRTGDAPDRRRLLAMAGEESMTIAKTGVPVGAAFASCGFILIFVTVLCACHEKKRKEIRIQEPAEENGEDEVTLNKITLRGSGAAYASPHNGAELYAVPCKVKEEPRWNGKEDNNGVGMGHKRDDSRGSRCATLDRRLPAPPTSVNTDPDDIDPTYDIIPGEKASHAREDDNRTMMDSDSQSYEPINRIYAVPEEKKSTEILYEEVNNTRPQSMIEDIMERTSMMEASIHSVHSAQSSHSARRSSYFSDSDERPRSNLSARLSVRSLEEHYASPDEARLSSGEITPVADMRHSFPGSLYDEDFPHDPPPVPARRYGEDEIINSGILPEELLAPYVPPLIAAAAFPLLDTSEVAVPALPSMAPAPIVPVIATVPAMPAMDFQDPPDSRYIQVTARESLASIRARQAMQRHDYDNFYEPIDGDEPPPPPVRPISPPRESLDMYGADYDEINYAVAGNGIDDQSDTGLYSDIKDSPAPTPLTDPPRVPPLHASSFMENTSIIYADADSPLPNRRNRAMTTSALPSSNGYREPVYAVPNKAYRNRARSEPQEPLSEAPIYAMVDKPRKRDVNQNQHDTSLEASASADFDVRAPLANYDAETSFDKSPSNGSYEGVRIPACETELRTRIHEPPSDRTSVDSGLYQRVDINEKTAKPETRYSNLSEDANYSIIPHEEKNFAKEQMFHMSNHHVKDDFWVRQEHVYQELDEEMGFPQREIPVTVL